jgi:hypothetical protein
MAGADFVALAVAREEGADEIKRNLQEEPRYASVVVKRPGKHITVKA